MVTCPRQKNFKYNASKYHDMDEFTDYSTRHVFLSSTWFQLFLVKEHLKHAVVVLVVAFHKR